MNKKWKDIIGYAVIFIFIFIVPTMLQIYFDQRRSEDFDKWANEKHEICVQRAERDSIDKRWCDEIRSTAKVTYNSAVNSSNNDLLLRIFQPLLFVLLIGMMNLKKQVEELKEKIND